MLKVRYAYLDSVDGLQGVVGRLRHSFLILGNFFPLFLGAPKSAPEDTFSEAKYAPEDNILGGPKSVDFRF